MLITLLFLSHASAEWMEINQQHYLKPVKVIQNPAFINAPNKDSQEKTIRFKKPVYNQDKVDVKPNRIYINHTILYQGWNDEFTDSSEISESSTAKFTRKIRPLSSDNNLAQQSTLKADKVLNKDVKVKEIVRVTDKILINKNSEAKKAAPAKKPNRIYIDDEHSGSLEVHELSDLEKLAEEDSEEYFRNHIQFKQTSPANVPKNEVSTQKTEKHEDYAIERGTKTRKKTKEPSNLFNTNTLRRVDIIKNSNNEHVIETDTAPEKSVAFIKKHMVAKITKVDIPIKTKTSTGKNKIGSQEHEHVKNEVKSKGTQFDKNGQSVIKTTTSEISNIISTSTTNKPNTKKNNRYEHHGAKKSEKVPDPEAIMIKEILSENDDTDVTNSSTEKGDKDDRGIQVVGDPESKKHAKAKGQKAPDPDAAMIQELLSEVAQMSHETTTEIKHQNNNVGSIQIFEAIPTRKPAKSTQILIKKDKSPIVKKTDMIRNQVSSQESSSVKNIPVLQFKEYQIIKKPGIIYDDDQSSSQGAENYYTTLSNLNNMESDIKTDKIGKIPDTNDSDVELSTEKLIALITPNIKTQTSTEKGSVEFDSRDFSYKPVKTRTSTETGSIEFDSREYSYKPVIRLREEKPEFVSKEEFFTESQEVVDLQENYSEPEQLSTIEPVIPSTDNILESTIPLRRGSENIEQTTSKNKEVKVDKKEEHKEEINTNEKKDSTMENVVKLLKVVTDIISRNTRKSFTSKVRYLEGLKDTLLANIEERIEATFPSPTRAARSGPPRSPGPRAAATARGHVDFPSSESALMTISFLTFAVFLIKLVLQVIHTYKSKTAIPTVVAAVGRAAGRWQRQHSRN